VVGRTVKRRASTHGMCFPLVYVHALASTNRHHHHHHHHHTHHYHHGLTPSIIIAGTPTRVSSDSCLHTSKRMASNLRVPLPISTPLIALHSITARDPYTDDHENRQRATCNIMQHWDSIAQHSKNITQLQNSTTQRLSWCRYWKGETGSFKGDGAVAGFAAALMYVQHNKTCHSTLALSC
jgi:hypothetical protein